MRLLLAGNREVRYLCYPPRKTEKTVVPFSPLKQDRKRALFGLDFLAILPETVDVTVAGGKDSPWFV